MVELSAAVFVITIGLLGTAKLCSFGLDRLRTIEEQTIALQTIQNEIETLRAAPFSTLTDGTHAFITTPSLERLGPLVDAHVTISPHALNGLKEVSAVIIWRTENGRRTECSLTTLIADKQP